MIDRYSLIRVLVPGIFTTIIATSSYAVIDAGLSSSETDEVSPLAVLTSIELPTIQSRVISTAESVRTDKIEWIQPDPFFKEIQTESTQANIKSDTVSSEILISGTTKLLTSTQSIQTQTPFLQSVQDVPKQAQWSSRLIKPGETLSVIFEQMGLGYTALREMVASNHIAKELTELQVGKTLDYRILANGELDQLIYHKNNLETITVTKTEHGFQVAKNVKDLQRVLTFTQGTIQSSLFWDAKRAGLSDNLTMQLANIYAWDIDFALDLRVGDKFSVLHEAFVDNNKVIKTGHIVAANFINKGKSHKAVRYDKENNKFKYYSPDGKSLHTRFLKTPVEFARISSKYNLRRKHPVLNRIRAHKGVDYAAATGTRVRSTASGKIIFRGRKGGYGNVVIVKHDRQYETLYAHLSKFRKKFKKGSRVEQGDVIGYIGSTGLATGPHLHYEFHVNGKHKNPLTVSLAQANPIRRGLLADFKAKTQPLLNRLADNNSISVAQIDTQ